jgi:predicted RNase H-like HicB family nuclease
LGGNGIRLGIGFRAGKELEEGKQYPFVRNVEGLLSLVSSVPNAGIYFDTWDWVVGDGAMDQVSELKADDIVAVRLGSVPADVDITKATSVDRILPEKEGTLNHVSVVQHLSSIGFDGPLSPSASSTRYKGQTRESTVQKAQEAIDGIFKDAGLHVAPLPMELIEDIPYEATTTPT